MNRISQDFAIWLVVAIPFATVVIGILLAVFGKAFGKCPFYPDEAKVFRKSSLPRANMMCFQ
jgi:hypothetical protein